MQTNSFVYMVITIDGTPQLKDALRLLYPLASSWQNIGALLGLPKDVLDSIKQDEQGVHNRLREMVSWWVKQANPSPTWGDLAFAVETVDQQKAQELRNQCCVK